MSLLDIIKTKLNQPTQAPQLGATEQASNLLRTKLTGQALPTFGAEPKRSAIGEQAAIQAGQGQIDLENQQMQTAAAQLGSQQAEQEQRTLIQQQQIAQGRRQKEEAAKTQADEILAQYEGGKKKIQSDKDIANLEQAAFGLRLNNKRYIDQLNQEAARAGLDNEVKFKEAYNSQVFGDMQNAFKDKLQFAKLMAADNRTFIQEMANLDINQALQVANAASQEANMRGLTSGLGGLISGGLQAYKAYEGITPERPKTAGKLEGEDIG